MMGLKIKGATPPAEAPPPHGPSPATDNERERPQARGDHPRPEHEAQAHDRSTQEVHHSKLADLLIAHFRWESPHTEALVSHIRQRLESEREASTLARTLHDMLGRALDEQSNDTIEALACSLFIHDHPAPSPALKRSVELWRAAAQHHRAHHARHPVDPNDVSLHLDIPADEAGE